MNRNYIILTFIMLALAVGTLFLHLQRDTKQIQPEALLWNVLQPTRFVTTDQVAKRLIEKDPSLLLIDVRPASEYERYTLPGALNVPLDSLYTSAALTNFGIPGAQVVLFANDAVAADEAWVILRRLNFKNNYVMKGGLNQWVETIIRPVAPDETAPETAFEKYNFRKAASMYFTGAKMDVNKDQKTKVVFKKRKKAVVATGGC